MDYEEIDDFEDVNGESVGVWFKDGYVYVGTSGDAGEAATAKLNFEQSRQLIDALQRGCVLLAVDEGYKS